jgi:DNA-binding NarL/FixJ family response regulator
MHFLVPGPLDQVTGGYLFDRRVVEGLRARGRSVRVVELGGRFPDVDASALRATEAAREGAMPPLSPAQQRVLEALCRPLAGGGPAVPPSNREIADELFVSVETVKSHMRVLFERFAVDDMPQNRKRAELARRALERGAAGH